MAYALNLAHYRRAFAQPLALGEWSAGRPQLWLQDPFLSPPEEALPFLHPIPSGRFPVELAGEHQDWRYLRIRFRPVEALYFELGLTAETWQEELGADEFFGVSCESGWLHFGDRELPPAARARLRKKTRGEKLIWDESGLALAVGEGIYPLFFGYEREPRPDEALYPVCAVLDALKASSAADK